MKRYSVLLVLFFVLVFAPCCNRQRERVVNRYDNGQPALVRVYDRSGQCVKEMEYYENGVLKMEGTMEDGHREGEWKCYFPDGKTQSTGFFHEGLRTGKASVYHENGNIYMEGHYKDNRHTGEWKYYDEQGYLLRIDDYGE